MKEVFDTYGLASLPVAIGSKGFHIWTRLDPLLDYSVVGRASHALARLIEVATPDRATGAFLKKDRHGRVFMDWLRNGPGSTVAVPFSLRPRPSASVAMPITWDELATTDPDQWTLGMALERAPDAPSFPPPSVFRPRLSSQRLSASISMSRSTTLDETADRLRNTHPFQVSPSSGVRRFPST